MTQNEQNLINKINELQNVIEWQKKTILQRELKIQELELIIKGKDVIIQSMAQEKNCQNCIYFDDEFRECNKTLDMSVPQYIDFTGCGMFNSKENQDILE